MEGPASQEGLLGPEAATRAAIAEEAPMFGLLDVLILLALLGFAIYWLFLRRKKAPSFDPAAIKTFSIETNIQKTDNSSFIGKMKSTGRNIVVFYGSQTGTAEEFAARLAKEANRFGLKAMVADPEECEMEDLTKLPEINNSMAIFCMATYGEGDPTDNAQDFYQWLQDGSVELPGVHYAVFALGNKTYEHFNAMGKYVDKRMEELGATRVFELGQGDDDANIEEDFVTWKERFWNTVCENFHLEMSGEDINLRQYQLIVHEDLPDEKVFHGEISRLNSYSTQKMPFDAKNPFLAPVRAHRELYKGSRSCMHIEISIAGSKIRYDSGDHVAVYPMNDIAIVENLGRMLKVDLDTVITLKNLDEDSSKKHPFPCPTSYRTALLYYVDITTPPRTHVLKEISEYATDEEEKKKLRLMSSSSDEGKSLYKQWVLNDCRSVVHILEDLPSARPPLDHLLELMPRLQARYYSISSSPKVHPDTIHMTAVKVEYETPTKRVNHGVATGWLASKRPDNGTQPRLPVYVRRSQFKLPSRPQVPIIMVGPGTGLAPFRGFIQERDFMRREGKPIGEVVLYFGCRKRDEDYLYREELEQYLADGTLSKLYLAFSRDQAEKVYVTHLLRQNKDEVWDLIGQKNGHFYICGDARNMARDVHEILVEIFCENGNMTQEEAAAYLKRMESQRRYSADVWS
ncbi:NADPH--cytochrome P450 reductase isoform X3 [Ixodes scapularis]|nr:NADPH--cytochrome P450 reductase isoform X3 [Ixodes scapularis]XP_029847791.2 NADPH--cytochrome P450 reductase isoform X3 [Ixodes scapularis]